MILEPQLFELSEKELVTATLKKRRDRLLKLYKVKILQVIYFFYSSLFTQICFNLTQVKISLYILDY